MFKFKLTKKNKGYIKLTNIIPNLITLTALGFGTTSIIFSINNHWQTAITLMIIASILDGIDGKIARLLGSNSAFGAELDSLCDFVNFGVAPGLMIYLWFLEYKSDLNFLLVWGIILIYCICMAIRLARFNTSDPDNSFNKKFFLGVPSPCCALLVSSPIMLNLEINWALDYPNLIYAYLWYILLVSFLCVSTIPTVSLKNLAVKHRYLKILVYLSVIFIMFLILYTWYLIPVLGIIYLSSLPISWYYGHKHLKSKEN